VDHIKDKRNGLINTTFIWWGPYWWGPGAVAPLDSPKSGPDRPTVFTEASLVYISFLNKSTP